MRFNANIIMRILSILFHTDLSKNSPHTLLNPLTPKSVEFLIEVFTGVAVLTEEKKLQRANEKRSENKQIQVLLLFSEGDVACFLDQSLRFESEKQRNPILHLTFD